MKTAALSNQLADGVAAAGVFGRWVTRDDFGHLPHIKGAYVLAVRLDQTVHIDTPIAVAGQLTPGWYLYLGSAWGSGGIRARVGRHFRHRKKKHWHIDQLTAASVDIVALAVVNGHECELVAKLLQSRHFNVALTGFGSTDCRRCESHLLASTGL